MHPDEETRVVFEVPPMCPKIGCTEVGIVWMRGDNRWLCLHHAFVLIRKRHYEDKSAKKKLLKAE